MVTGRSKQIEKMRDGMVYDLSLDGYAKQQEALEKPL
jgi:hypothetical protein